MSLKLVIVVIIAVLLLVLGGWYFLGNGELQNINTANQEQGIAEDATVSIEASLGAGPSDEDPNSEFNGLNQSVQGF